MNARLCPNCSSLIESDVSFFCYNCGEELPPLKSEAKSPATGEDHTTPRRKTRVSLTSFLITLVFCLWFGLVAGSLYFFLQRSGRLGGTSAPSSVLKPYREFVATTAALPIAPFDFGASNLTDFLPTEVDLSIQGRLPALILARLMSDDQRGEFQEKTGLTLPEAISFLDDDYVFAKKSDHFLLLFRLKDANFVKTKVEEFSSSKTLVGQVFNDVLVISNSTALSQAVLDVVGKRALSLTQTKDFAEAHRLLPKSGQLLVYARERPRSFDFLRQFLGDSFEEGLTKVGGESFVVTVESGNLKLVGTDER